MDETRKDAPSPEELEAYDPEGENRPNPYVVGDPVQEDYDHD